MSKDVVTKITMDEGAVLPFPGSNKSAGYDLCALLPEGIDVLEIAPHTTSLIGTGLHMAIPEGCFGGIFARSGLATKKGLRPANCVGVVDADYRGEVKVALHNDTDVPQRIENGERIAQFVLLPFILPHFEVCDELDETERGEGGFGSTGTK